MRALVLLALGLWCLIGAAVALFGYEAIAATCAWLCAAFVLIAFGAVDSMRDPFDVGLGEAAE